jgi:DNA-binding response OmpR family regulator
METEKEPSGPVVTDPGGAETILLVEDNEQVRNLVFTILQRKGYAVLVAEDGKKALDILDQHKGALDLMLTDVVMPGMNGKELFNRVIEKHAHLKVIYMSGYTANVIAHRGILDEGTDFIQKPFSTEDLAVKVREVLDRNKGV